MLNTFTQVIVAVIGSAGRHYAKALECHTPTYRLTPNVKLGDRLKAFFNSTNLEARTAGAAARLAATGSAPDFSGR